MGTRCGLRSASSVASRATLAISSLARIFDEMKGRLSGMAGNNTSPIILVLSVPYTWHLDDSILFSDMLNRRDGRLLRWGIFPDDCIFSRETPFFELRIGWLWNAVREWFFNRFLTLEHRPQLSLPGRALAPGKICAVEGAPEDAKPTTARRVAAGCPIPRDRTPRLQDFAH